MLFLQGPSSLFFSALGDACAARGARVVRAVFCPGDRLFWRRPGAIPVRGSLAAWPETLRSLIDERAITDLVMLGDGRPRHAAAIEIARELDLRAHCVELGYFRPDWLTHEIGGVGGGSPFPRDRAGVLAMPAGPLPDQTPAFPARFARMAALDVAYNLSNALLGPFGYRRYRHHQPVHPVVEYAGWAVKLARGPARARAADRAVSDLLTSGAPYFLLPLQLEGDFQLTRYGPAAPLRDTVRDIARSFAEHAPPETRLVVKRHPMENGWTRWERILSDQPRCVVLDGGDLDALIAGADGVVTVNSTVGLQALMAGKRVKTLGRAIYEVEDLVDPADLDAFWTSSFQPDIALARRFAGALARATQIRGAFDGPGARPGAEAIAERIMTS